MSVIWAIFLMANETLLLFSQHSGLMSMIQTALSDNAILNFFISIMMICAMVGSSFVTIFRLKFSDYLQLVPGHTDCVTFCSIASLVQQLVTVTCFNYMMLTGQITIFRDYGGTYIYETSFVHFYTSMLQTPFLGN
jgi:hypothetical protein